MDVVPEGGMIWRDVVPKEKRGGLEDVVEDDEETEEDEPRAGLLGREAGSVLSQAFIVNTINNANP